LGSGVKRQNKFSVKVENRGAVVTEAGSYLWFVDYCITQLKAQGPSRTCNGSNEEEECEGRGGGEGCQRPRHVCHPTWFGGWGWGVLLSCSGHKSLRS